MTRKEEIQKAAEDYYNEVKYLSDLSAFPIAAFKAGAKWADKTILDKVYKYLYRKLENGKVLSSQLIDNLKKAMEE